ncbi:MAG: PKD domain-containing protein [Candidatus Margulisbacteria bacterium]|nr:PKD domain-containing protein [Candidatus Margulisiibacteriota bacterium]
MSGLSGVNREPGVWQTAYAYWKKELANEAIDPKKVSTTDAMLGTMAVPLALFFSSLPYGCDSESDSSADQACNSEGGANPVLTSSGINAQPAKVSAADFARPEGVQIRYTPESTPFATSCDGSIDQIDFNCQIEQAEHEEIIDYGNFDATITFYEKPVSNIQCTATDKWGETTFVLYPPEVTSTSVDLPLAGIKANSSALSGTPVEFQAINPDESVYSYLWEFGDGTSLVGPVVSKTYAVAPGTMETYNIRLTVSRIDDPTVHSSAMQSIVIYTEADLPLAGINAVSKALSGTPVEFQAVDSDESAYTYLWEFGDGTNATGAVVNKTYAIIPGTMGTYTVRLTVSRIDNPSVHNAVTQGILIYTE